MALPRIRLACFPLMLSLVTLACGGEAHAARPRLVTDRGLIDFSPRAAMSPEDSVLATLPHPWPGRAMLLSIAGCAAPFAAAALMGEGGGLEVTVLAVGLTVLPSAGHVYAGQSSRALRWSLVRAVGAAFVIGALEDGSRVSEGGAVPAAAGGLLVLGVAGLEVLVTPVSVQRANTALARSRLHATVLPVRGGAQLRVGLALAVP